MQTCFTIMRVKLSDTIWLLTGLVIFFGCGNQKVQQESNKSVIADKEWRSLFDGKTTEGWRAINSEKFPGEGWKVADGMLMVNAVKGEEPGIGGDIITTAQYRDFVLDWASKMLTRGGNSGVKYFVTERLCDNGKHGIGLEYQILDDENFSWMLDGRMQPGDYRTLGSLYEIYAAKNKSPKPLGEWNH